jgi:hypothetical protein
MFDDQEMLFLKVSDELLGELVDAVNARVASPFFILILWGRD